MPATTLSSCYAARNKGQGSQPASNILTAPAQAYVRDRILAFAVEPAFAKRMYMAPDDVREAATEAMAELARPLDSSSSACSYKLVFRHTCL